MVNIETAYEEEITDEDKLHDQLGSFDLVVYPHKVQKESIFINLLERTIASQENLFADNF